MCSSCTSTASRSRVTYTDVHLRASCSSRTCSTAAGSSGRTPVRASDDAKSRTASTISGVGALRGESPVPSCATFLEFLGSRLVFLIDWNKARKRLRNFVPNDEAIKLLKWAADADIGHMAFLKAGGEQLVFDALEFAAKDQYRFGEPMHELLGLRETRDYLRFVLRTCAELLRKGEPEFARAGRGARRVVQHISARGGRSCSTSWRLHAALCRRDCRRRPRHAARLSPAGRPRTARARREALEGVGEAGGRARQSDARLGASRRHRRLLSHAGRSRRRRRR